MKIKAHIKVAKSKGKKGYKISASTSPNLQPLKHTGEYSNTELLPTVFFVIDFDIDDNLFEPQENLVAKINISKEEGGRIFGKQVKMKIEKAIKKATEPIISEAAMKAINK